MKSKQLLTLVFLILLVLLLPFGATAQVSGQEDQPGETELEQSLARAAELNPTPPVAITTLAGVNAVQYPLFVGVDDVTIPAYQIDPASNDTVEAFVGAQVWGAAYDPVNRIVYFNNGSTLYEWPVGGVVISLGTIVDTFGATQSMVGLAFYDGTLYGTKNIANEAVWIIDPTTLEATVYIDYVDADFDFGGLAADPNTGELYATNDDTTPNGSGLFRINLDGSGTLIAPYPDAQTDIDGLAISDDGFAYLVTDEPGFIYVYDFAAAAYTTPLNNPWTTAEVFSSGAWLFEPSIVMSKTVGTDPLACAVTDEITIMSGEEATYCFTVENTGDVTLNLHTLFDLRTGNNTE